MFNIDTATTDMSPNGQVHVKAVAAETAAVAAIATAPPTTIMPARADPADDPITTTHPTATMIPA